MRRSRAILLGTLIVGTLDALDAVVFFGLRNGTPPMRIFQSIAAGLIGRGSFSGGLRSAVLGVVLHYFVAFGIACTYILASARVPLLTRRWLLCGAIYGVGAYFFMNLVVIPLSAIGPQRQTLSAPFFNGIFVHVLGVGWPTAFLAASIGPSHSNWGRPRRRKTRRHQIGRQSATKTRSQERFPGHEAAKKIRPHLSES